MYNKLWFLFLLITIVIANDDGQYRPGRYGNEGKYVHTGDGQYVHNKESHGSGFKNIAPPFKSSGSFGSSGSFRSTGSSTSFASAKSQSSKSTKSFASSNSGNNQFINRFVVDTASSNLSPFRQPAKVSGKGNFGASKGNEANIRILKQDVEVNPDSYHFAYETENDIKAEEEGRLINVNTKNEGIAATGYYEYIGPDNIKYRVEYIADENGFQPLGVHLPTPPPIPKEIQTLLRNLGKK